MNHIDPLTHVYAYGGYANTVHKDINSLVLTLECITYCIPRSLQLHLGLGHHTSKLCPNVQHSQIRYSALEESMSSYDNI